MLYISFLLFNLATIQGYGYNYRTKDKQGANMKIIFVALDSNRIKTVQKNGKLYVNTNCTEYDPSLYSQCLESPKTPSLSDQPV
jgi:hypothetical protein